MRLLAGMFAVMAVAVWWAPLSRFVQSVVLGWLVLAILALRSAWARLDKVNAAVREAKEVLREVRDERDGGTPS